MYYDELAYIAESFENGDLRWIQKTSFAAFNGFCSQGAIDFMFDRKTPVEVYKAVAETIMEQYPEYNRPMPGMYQSYKNTIQQWNDRTGRTKEEVIRIFQKTALKLEEQML